MVRRLILVALLLPSVANAQKQTYNVYYSGTKSGESVGEIGPDGHVTSKMNLKIGPVVITSNLDCHIKNGMMTDCSIDSTQGGQTTKVVWKDEKYTVTRAGKEVAKDVPYKPQLKAAFSVFHPLINGLLWDGLQGQAGKSKALLVDSLAELDVTFKPRQAAQGVIWSVELGGTGIDLAFSTDGKPLGVDVPSQKLSFVLEGRNGLFVDPLAKYPELSQPTFKTKTETRVRMTARDGTRLMADISRPDAPGKFPTILIRTPYGRAASLVAEDWLVKRGYAVVSQDVRGRGGSDGEFDPLVWEKKDGYDTLEWLTEQPWCDGKVGMIGGSYLGYVQWAAASTGHPALKCIVPQVSPPQPDMNFPWDHGNFLLMGSLWWGRVVKDRLATTAVAFAPLTNLSSLRELPLTNADNKFYGSNLDFFDKWLKRPTLADWGDVFTTEDVKRVKVPALHVSGFWDGDGIGTAIHWSARNTGTTRDWLLFGPWTHLFNSSHSFGDQEYGEGAILELDSVYLRFFDTYLKGQSVKLESQPRVKFFVSGSNKWIDAPSWPPPNSTVKTWYLDGKALSAAPGNGSTSYRYDPNNPEFKAEEANIDITGTTTVVPADKAGTTAEFQTKPFAQDTTLAAPMSVELYVSTTAKDASFQVTVLDVDEKGVRRYIGMPGVQRATYVDNRNKPLAPGEVRRITVEPWWFAREFKKGHRLAINVTSDTFPRYARVPGTGGPDWQATVLKKARQTIWFSPKRPSKVTLWQIG